MVDEFFKTHYPTSVCTVTSTELVAAVTSSPTTVALVPTKTPTGPLKTKSPHSAAPRQAAAQSRPQTGTHQPQQTNLAEQMIAHQRVPRPAQTPRRNESPQRKNRKHCLHPDDTGWPDSGPLHLNENRLTDDTGSSGYQTRWSCHAKENNRRH